MMYTTTQSTTVAQKQWNNDKHPEMQETTCNTKHTSQNTSHSSQQTTSATTTNTRHTTQHQQGQLPLTSPNAHMHTCTYRLHTVSTRTNTKKTCNYVLGRDILSGACKMLSKSSVVTTWVHTPPPPLCVVIAITKNSNGKPPKHALTCVGDMHCGLCHTFLPHDVTASQLTHACMDQRAPCPKSPVHNMTATEQSVTLDSIASERAMHASWH